MINKEMLELDINDIRTNPKQARKHFDEEKILVLADSIKEIGLNTPIKLSWCEGTDGKKATLIDGERRYRALKHAKIDKLKYGKDYIITESKNEDVEYESLIANCMREDLQPCEKGEAFLSILKRREIKSIDVATNVVNRAKDYKDNGIISEPSSRNFFIPKETVIQVLKDMRMIGVSGTNAVDLLKILKLPKDIQQKIIFSPPNTKIYKEKIKINRFGKAVERKRNDRGDFIPMSFARELARLDNEKIVRFFIRKATDNGWSTKKMTLMTNDYLRSHLTAEQYMDAYNSGIKQCNIETRQKNEAIEGIITDMDNFSSTLTSFRTINLVALADSFQQKMFMVTAKGLHTSTKRLLFALDDLLLTTKDMIKQKDEERKELVKMPFRVKMTTPPHMKAKAYRFTIPKEIGEKLKLECGDDVELQINAVFRDVKNDI